ncbi:polysaccharide lyase family protein [Actinophytocola oryzae]|uniref:Polysaccharide lyase family 4-like protein n=1 Tax=Actinophytocola oryzae TaxID=502181 RepID=A0A4R7W6J1_9PSEU|nr:polysaccharide lyase family protein [Actinophytocola oryzae]TDV57649.1 polysaccharide lyase family 4-like protein [Actinophytocola oryzae]
MDDHEPTKVSRRTVLTASLASATAAFLVANGGRALAAPATTTPGNGLTVRPASFGAVFAGTRARFDVTTGADSLDWTVRDVWGEVTRSGESRVRNGRATVDVETGNGYHTLEVVASRHGAEVARDRSSFAVLEPYRLPHDSPFGANTHLPPLELLPLMVTLGITWARVDLTWTEIEPPPLAGWTPDVFQADATVELDRTVAHTGRASAKLVNRTPIADNHYATVSQALTVRPNTTYVFSAWVQGQNVRPKALQFTVRPDWGSRVDAPSGTFGWTKVVFRYTTGPESVLTFRLLSSDVVGAAWLDDVSVTVEGSDANLLTNPGFERGLVTGYNFDTFTPYFKALSRNGINPLPILDYANPKYDGGLTPHTDAGRAAFAAYSTAAMKRFRGQVGAVEVFNEFNAGWFTTGPASGDPKYYAALLESTYKAVKAVDPSIVVVGGVTYGTALDWLKAVFDAGGMAHLDVVSNHPYVGIPESPDAIDEAEREVAALVRQYNGGRAKPVWVSELGWSLGDGLTAAGYLVRGLVLSLAGGVGKFFWYDLVGDQNFGLLNEIGADTYTPRPVYAAYAVAIRMLTGATLRGQDVAGPLRRYVFSGRDGDVAVLWSTDPRTAVALPTDRALDVVDLTGAATRLTPLDGKVHLTLTGAPVYVRTTARATQNGRFDVTAPPLVRTSDRTVTLTYVVDNSGGADAADVVFTSLGKDTRVTARRGQRVEKAAAVPLTSLAAGRNTIVTAVSAGRHQVGRLMTAVVVLDVPDGALATVGVPDWTDHELALAPGSYADYPTRFPNDVTFTAGVDDPAQAWSYIQPGPDDGWAGSRVHRFTLDFTLASAPTTDLRLVVYLLDTHNTAPGTVDVALNSGAATTVTLPGGSGAGYANGSALDSGVSPSQFTVSLSAAHLKAGANTVTIDKTSGSWLVYDALGIYPA